MREFRTKKNPHNSTNLSQWNKFRKIYDNIPTIY